MKRDKYYRNKRTDECTTDHKTAVEWYRSKDEIEVWDWSDLLGKMVLRLEWVH